MKTSQATRKPASNKASPVKSTEARLYESPKSKEASSMGSKLTELQHQIDLLQKQRDDLVASERADAIATINSMIRTYGIQSRDLNFGEANKPAKQKLPAKYKLGNLSWSGRGHKPKWMDDHVAKGGTLDEILVK